MYLGFKGRDPQIFKFKLQEVDAKEARALPFWSKATLGPGVSGSHSRRSTAPSFPPFLSYPYQRHGEPARRARLWFSVIKFIICDQGTILKFPLFWYSDGLLQSWK